MSRSPRRHPALIALGAGVLFCAASSQGRAEPLVEAAPPGDWRSRFGGFIELDTIVDSTRSFPEAPGSLPVALQGTAAGDNGRLTMSARNTRLSYELQAPVSGGWRTRAYGEVDFLGYDPAPPANAESTYLTSPSMRIRQFFFEATREAWTFWVGQTWSLLGWDPYYFLGIVSVAPLTGEVYERTPQIQARYQVGLSASQRLQFAFSIERPAQRDSMVPNLDAALRWAQLGRKAAFARGTADVANEPLSIGLSGTLREFSVPGQAGALGSAVVADLFEPILEPAGAQDPSGSLAWAVEASSGQGYGDAFPGWSGGLANPLNAAPAAPYGATSLDAGQGGYDASGTFQLLHLRSLNTQLQYFLPGGRTFATAGYGELYCDNISRIVPSGPTAMLYDRSQVLFANVMRDFAPEIRLGLELAEFATHYVTGETARDLRGQLTAWYRF